jgi:hypothetical protein
MADPKQPGPGRPTLTGAPSTQTTFTLPTADFERLCRQARRDGISVGEAIRRQLRKDDDDSGTD